HQRRLGLLLSSGRQSHVLRRASWQFRPSHLDRAQGSCVRYRGRHLVLLSVARADYRRRGGRSFRPLYSMSLQSRLPQPYRVVRYDTVGSTNDEAKRLAREGAAEGTLVWAIAQTAGRGRRGHNWASPPGNPYASLRLRPNAPVGRAAHL